MAVVSVVIPVYQVSAYIERCLRSVMAQSYSQLEYIIVDDATQDDSIVKCERLIHDYTGPMAFRIIHHEQNQGLSAARNTGTKAATGDYIYYLDSDDDITPDCIEKLVKAAQVYPDAEMVVGNYLKISNEGVVLRNEMHFIIDEKVPPVIRSNEAIHTYHYQRRIPVYAWNNLIKRSFIEKNCLLFKEEIAFEDQLWMFYVVKYLSAVAVVRDITYHYYIRPGSITTASDNYRKGESFRVIYDDILHHLTIGRERRELKRYVEGFGVCYLNYKSIVPAYRDLFRLYRKYAREYRCRYAYMLLASFGIIGFFGIHSDFLEKINALRWKVRRLLW